MCVCQMSAMDSGGNAQLSVQVIAQAQNKVNLWKTYQANLQDMSDTQG